MAIQIKDQRELRRIRRLLSILNNRSVEFPITIFTAEDQTVAFMEGNPDREFSIRSEGAKGSFTISDRPGARMEWLEREVKKILADHIEKGRGSDA